MKCILCNQRKGKRSCPAKGALICAQCCGEKRILEIECPETCEYLKVGRSHEAHTQRMRHLYTADPAKMDKRRKVFSQFEDFIARMELFLADERRSSRDLADKDVAEAMDLILEAMRTEEKGIIYERVSSDLRVDSLRRRLKEVVEARLNPQEGSAERMRRSQVIECLEVIRDILESHMVAGPSGIGYVDFLARLMPRTPRISDSGPSLIIPGR
jgi:hypothetical protein